jgi:hypothetical protein
MELSHDNLFKGSCVPVHSTEHLICPGIAERPTTFIEVLLVYRECVCGDKYIWLINKRRTGRNCLEGLRRGDRSNAEDTHTSTGFSHGYRRKINDLRYLDGGDELSQRGPVPSPEPAVAHSTGDKTPGTYEREGLFHEISSTVNVRIVHSIPPLKILMDPFALLKRSLRRVAHDRIKTTARNNLRKPITVHERIQGMAIAGRAEHPRFVIHDLRPYQSIAAENCLPEIPEYRKYSSRKIPSCRTGSPAIQELKDKEYPCQSNCMPADIKTIN